MARTKIAMAVNTPKPPPVSKVPSWKMQGGKSHEQKCIGNQLQTDPFALFISLLMAPIAAKQGAQEVEDEERICGQRRKKGSLHIGPDLPAVLGNFIKAAVEYAKGTHDIFLRNQAGDCCNRSLPMTPAQRGENQAMALPITARILPLTSTLPNLPSVNP